VDRGGFATYHGPGQLVGYLVANIGRRGPVDVVRWMEHGMRIRHGVTSHGFALNIDPDMTAFDRFTVCGLQDVTMTSLRRVADARQVAMPSEASVKDALAASLVF
jgi:lipoyl(octanoyl) transferase